MMRIQKTTFYLSFFILIVFVLLTLILEFSAYELVISIDREQYHIAFFINVCIGICASALLIGAYSLSSYFVQRKTVANDIWLSSSVYLYHFILFVSQNRGLQYEALDANMRQYLASGIVALQVEHQNNVLLINRYQTFFKRNRMNANLHVLKTGFDIMHMSLSRIQRTLIPAQGAEQQEFEDAMRALDDIALVQDIVDQCLGKIARRSGIKVQNSEIVQQSSPRIA